MEGAQEGGREGGRNEGMGYGGRDGGTEGRRIRRSAGAREEESVDGGKGEWRRWRGWRAGEEGCVSHLKRILSVAIFAQASASFLRTFSLFLELHPAGRWPAPYS